MRKLLASTALLLLAATSAVADSDNPSDREGHGPVIIGGQGGRGGDGGTGIGIGGNASAVGIGGDQSQYQGQRQGQSLRNSNSLQADPRARATSTSGASAEGGGAYQGPNSYTDRTKTTAIAVAPPSFSYSVGGSVGTTDATEGWSIGFPVIGGGYGDTTVVPTATGVLVHAHNLALMRADYETGPENSVDGSAAWSDERALAHGIRAAYCSYDTGRRMFKAFTGSNCD